MVERRVPRWSELRELARPRRPPGDATDRRLARAATVGDLREIARRRVPRAVFDYTDGAAGAEISLRRSRAAFERVEFRPERAARRLGGRPVDDAARRPGRAAAGLRADRLHPAHAHRGRDRRSAGSPSGSASPTRCRPWAPRSLEALAAAAPGRPAVVPALPLAGPRRQRRARRAGPGRRLRGAGPDRRHPGRRTAAARRPQRLHDPAGADPADRRQRRRPPALVGRPADHRRRWSSPRCAPGAARSPSWSTGSSSRPPRSPTSARSATTWPGALVVKGILDADDARAVVDAGADAVVVSNHGGRQLDRAPTPLEQLPGDRGGRRRPGRGLPGRRHPRRRGRRRGRGLRRPRLPGRPGLPVRADGRRGAGRAAGRRHPRPRGDPDDAAARRRRRSPS